MKKDLHDAFLITHKNCLDGSLCAALFMAAGGMYRNIYFCNPNHETVDDLVMDLVTNQGEDNIIIIADVSMSVETAEKVSNYYHNIFLFDHHNSAIALDKFSFCEIETKNKRCGSLMLLDWLKTQERLNNLMFFNWDDLLSYTDLIKAVDDNDRWVHNIPESVKIASLHKLLGQDGFVERAIRNPSTTLAPREKYLIEVYEKNREIETRKRKDNTQIYTKNIQGHDVRVGIVTAYGDDQSFLGDALYTDLELDIDIAIIVNGDGVSLRCSRDCPVDLSKLAKLNGGGGHIQASGCGLGGILGQDFLGFVMSKMKFN